MRKNLKTGCGFLFLIAAFIFTGDRLALTSAKPNLLRFAHTFTTASERAILNKAIAEFENAHPPVKIEQVIYNSETYQTIGWRLQFKGRQQPDLYFVWQGFKVEYAIAHGWALELTPHLSPGFLDQFTPAVVQRHKNGIYQLPQSVDISNLVWYNREIFSRQGLREPRNLAEWLRLCRQLRQAGVLPLIQGNRDLWPMGNFGAELLGQSLGADKLKRLFIPNESVRPEDVRGLQTLAWLEQNGGFDAPGLLQRGDAASLGDIDAKVFFLSGKAAQHIIGSWFLADIQDAQNKNELNFAPDVFPVPAAQEELNAMTAVATGYVVNPASKNPAVAAAFLELLLSRKYQTEFAKLGNLSARRDATEFTSAPLAKRLLQILAATPVTVPPPDTGYRPEQANVFYELCAKILTAELTVAEAADFWNREKQALAKKGL